MANNRRPQTPKPRNLPLAKAMLELRQGSRTSPVPSGKQRNRAADKRSWKAQIR